VLRAVAPAAVAHCRVGQAGGGKVLIQRLGFEPLFEFEIALTDGTGSTAALSLIKLACALTPDAV